MSEILSWSGWIIGITSLAFSINEWMKRRLGERDRDVAKSQLLSVYGQLSALHGNIVEAHTAGDVVHSAAGKRFLSSLAFQIVGVLSHISVSLGKPVVLVAPLEAPPVIGDSIAQPSEESEQTKIQEPSSSDQQ